MSYLQVLLNDKLNKIYQNDRVSVVKEEFLLTFKELQTNHPYFHYAVAFMSEQDIIDVFNYNSDSVLPYFKRAITTSDLKYKLTDPKDDKYVLKYYNCLSTLYYRILENNNMSQQDFNQIYNEFFNSLNGHIENIHTKQLEFKKELSTYFHIRDRALLSEVKKTLEEGKEYEDRYKIIEMYQTSLHENLEVITMELYAIKQLYITLTIINYYISRTSDHKAISDMSYDMDLNKHFNALIDNLFNEYLYDVFDIYFGEHPFSADDTEVIDELTVFIIGMIDYYGVVSNNKFIRHLSDLIDTFLCDSDHTEV